MRVQGVALKHHGQVALARGFVRDVFAFEGERAVVDVLQACDHTQQGGFSAARRAHKNDEFTGLDVQVDAFDGAVFAKKLFDALELKIGHVEQTKMRE